MKNINQQLENTEKGMMIMENLKHQLENTESDHEEIRMVLDYKKYLFTIFFDKFSDPNISPEDKSNLYNTIDEENKEFNEIIEDIITNAKDKNFKAFCLGVATITAFIILHWLSMRK